MNGAHGSMAARAGWRVAAWAALCAVLLLGSLPVRAAEGPGAPATPEDWVGHRLPVFSARSLGGANLRTSEFAGEVLLVAFWASWCARCEDQLERAQQLADTYRSAGLVTLGVTLDDSATEARAFAAAAGANFPVMHDVNKTIGRRFALLDLPTILLVDRSGVIRQVYGRLDRKARAALVEDIRQLLDE